jgi:hypothetical protein
MKKHDICPTLIVSAVTAISAIAAYIVATIPK